MRAAVSVVAEHANRTKRMIGRAHSSPKVLEMVIGDDGERRSRDDVVSSRDAERSEEDWNAREDGGRFRQER